MTSWMPDRASLTRPAYLSLAEQLAQAIRRGDLAAGERLLPQRQLAHRLDLSLQTVSRAYEELIRRGLIAGAVGRGSFVLPAAAETRPPYLVQRSGEVVDLSILKPVTDRLHVERMREGLIWLAQNMPPQDALSFRPNSIMPPHQHVASDWLAQGGIDASPDRIVITDGATPAISTAVMTAVPPGGTLAAAHLTHHLLMPLARYLGLQLEPLAVDDHGVVPASLDRAARRGGLRAVYLQPAAINPRAVLSPADRRAEIVEVARRHDLTIIENDVLNALIVDRPPPYAALAPERVLHVSGFTKITLPGLRLAYLVVPERLATAAANRHLVTNWVATPVMVELLSHWLTDGTVAELIGWQRGALAERHALAAQMLAGLPFRAHPQSLHLWLELPPDAPEDDFVALAHSRGVAVASGRAFRLNERSGGGAVRIALGSADMGQLRHALGVISGMMARTVEPILPMI
ncbi:PLP-dependent aminotransferase family protein [Paracoccus sp. Z118]|uniref:MocR-like ectoine utilization transcription factor EhuR n=1 Tax=Paracoccus sp. Z118 TaxID=2851017 RepID=UPI001C2B79EF|nr:PLP-dependent aminotransferase family protein [Paracoccus sp. Z118]MBV0890362.1 PLP-dependent aminotransferase family protein [Paracoccus sp. Z118]